MKLLIGSIFIITLPVGTILLNSFVLMCLWGWFVVPVFHLPELSFFLAMGLALLLNFSSAKILTVGNDKPTNPTKKFLESVLVTILNPLIVLFLGWIIHLLI